MKLWFVEFADGYTTYTWNLTRLENLYGEGILSACCVGMVKI